VVAPFEPDSVIVVVVDEDAGGDVHGVGQHRSLSSLSLTTRSRVIVTTPGRAGTLMVRGWARYLTGGTLVEAGSCAAHTSRARPSGISYACLMAYTPTCPLQKRKLVQRDMGTLLRRRHWCRWKSMLRRPVFSHTLRRIDMTAWPSARLARLRDVWRSRDGPPQ
jgi:hypothetical protein